MVSGARRRLNERPVCGVYATINYMTPTNHPILFFDGVCNLCNGAVQWFIRRDRSDKLRFASLQSDLARELLPAAGVDPTRLNSLVLYEDGRAYTKSQGALRAASYLGGLWSRLASVAGVLPGGLRDAVYDLIARNRYRWFGQKAECMIPTPEQRARFVD